MRNVPLKYNLFDFNSSSFLGQETPSHWPTIVISNKSPTAGNLHQRLKKTLSTRRFRFIKCRRINLGSWFLKDWAKNFTRFRIIFSLSHKFLYYGWYGYRVLCMIPVPKSYFLLVWYPNTPSIDTNVCLNLLWISNNHTSFNIYFKSSCFKYI